MVQCCDSVAFFSVNKQQQLREGTLLPGSVDKYSVSNVVLLSSVLSFSIRFTGEIVLHAELKSTKCSLI